MTTKRIGTLLVERGVLDEPQVQRILEVQEVRQQPFGKLAHDLFGVDEQAIWSAWAEQTGPMCMPIDLEDEPGDPELRAIVTVEEAWRLRMLPLRYEGGKLVVATTVTDLPEAAALLSGRVEAEVRFVIPERRTLERRIVADYGIVAVECPGDHEREAAATR